MVDESNNRAAMPALRRRKRDWSMLALSGAVVLLAFVLTVRSDGRVAVRGLDCCLLPETCLSRAMLNVTCPGCGLTRSFVALSRGRLGESISYNRVGWLLALAVVIQFPYRIVSLRMARPPIGSSIPRFFGYLLIAALVINWIAASDSW